MSDHITAPERIIDAMRKLQETLDRLQMEAQAIQFGARAALDVPEGWQWDGSGWSEGRGARGELAEEEEIPG